MSLSLIDLSDVAQGTGGFAMWGEVAGTSFGVVGSAGDLNGDGFADLIIGAPDYSNLALSAGGAGEAYIIFGKAGGFAAQMTRTEIAAGPGTAVLIGADRHDDAGIALGFAGDVDGDGLHDVIIGAFQANGPAESRGVAGESYLIRGKESGWDAPLQLSTISGGSSGFAIWGEPTIGGSGYSVATAGDVNGDGFADLLIGTFHYGLSNAAYLVFGGPGGIGPVDLIAVAAGNGGFVIRGENGGDSAGAAVAAVGDINGDGFADILVGARRADRIYDYDAGIYDDLPDAGGAYVIFGKAEGWSAQVLLTDVAQGTGGFAIRGRIADELTGSSVSSAGDINGDGFADLLIGSPHSLGYAGGYVRAGAAYVVFGKAGGWDMVDLRVISAGSGGFALYGTESYDLAGTSVAGGGDVNGDGFDDLLISAPGADGDGNARGQAGDVYVIFGKASGWGAPTLLGNLVNGTDGVLIQGADTLDNIGRSLAFGGDIDGDGFDEIVIGNRFARSIIDEWNTGEAYLVFGGFSSAATHAGDGAANSLTGTAGDDAMVGGRGADTLTGGGGADALTGGEGNDLLVVADLAFRRVDGGLGVDTLRLSAALTLDLAAILDPRLQGIEAIDLVGATLRLTALELRNLSDNSNTLRLTGDGATLLLDDAGWTQGAIAGGVMTLTHGSARLLVESDIAISRLCTAGADSMSGGLGADSLGGLGGRDMISGGAGADSLDGGAGNDTLDYSASGAGVVIDFGATTQSGGDAEGDSISGFEAVKGSAFNDTLTGGGGNDTLAGMDGADALLGGDGNDLLNGGAGDDIMEGGLGDDLYVVDTFGDVAIESAGEGHDRVLSSADHTLRAEIEWLTLTGSAFHGAGNDLANRIDGNAIANQLEGRDGNDTLGGGAGTDTLEGGGGSDRMTGGAGADSFVYASAEHGGDRISLYDAAEDQMLVSATNFGGGLAMGALDPARFVANTSGRAEAALGQFIWETDAQRLWWDADGTGAGARVMLALMPGAGLTMDEITVIA